MNLLEQRKKVKKWIKAQIFNGLDGQAIIAAALRLSPDLHQAVLYELQDPAFTLRPKQEMPDGDWYIWFLRTGRGFGKNHAASAAINRLARYDFAGQQGLIVAATHKDFWHTIFNGPSGIKALAAPDFQPVYSERHLEVRWPNGSTAVVRTGDNPEDIRGLSVPWAYADELIKWPKGEVSWGNIQNCVREGSNPKIILTSTPLRGAEWLRKVEELPDTIVTTGGSSENKNLPATFFRGQRANLSDKKFAEEAQGEWVGADEFLWTKEELEFVTRDPQVSLRAFAETMDERMISIDPSGGGRDENGIILLGRKGDDLWVLGDFSCKGKASVWREEVIHVWRAYCHAGDRVLVETNANQGIDEYLMDGEPQMWVEGIQQTAKASKKDRAEQAQALYEQGRVQHFGRFPELMQQMVDFYDVLLDRNASPDRVDALSTGLREIAKPSAFIGLGFSIPNVRFRV
ncbi:terminase large subunit domain-containing protein [Sphingobium yanoikuyae]|uniref:terminase large subunit domain-containing protein n=1 Tax=Sphingobium yanoikuyae TaxID=13690 RepID=UPI003B91ED7E